MKKRYPSTLSSGANNTVVALTEAEVYGTIVPYGFQGL